MLRKERVHQTGISNADFRLRCTVDQRKERKPLFEARYKVHEANLAQTQMTPQAIATLSPAVSHSIFYNASGRRLVSQLKLSRPRTAALTRQKTVTGGDNDAYVQLAVQKTKGIEKIDEPAGPLLNQSLYHITKDIEHRKASQETQLVPVVTTNTAEGEVNTAKIAELRRAIRRRYASRSNFRKIFNDLDLNSKGQVSAADLQQMFGNIGVSINAAETQSLITSITGNDTQSLNMNDFLGLVFDECDTVNVDIAQLPKQIHKISVNSHDLEGGLKALAIGRKTEMLQGTMKEYLQHKLTDLSRLMLKADFLRTGVVSFDTFCDVMKKTELPPHMLNPQHLGKLYEDGGGTVAAGLDYKVFCDDIKHYVKPTGRVHYYDYKEANPLVKAIGERSASLLKRSKTADAIKPKLEGLLIVDPRLQPFNKLESLHNRAARPRNLLQDVYGSEEALAKALEEFARGKAVTREQLYDFVGRNVKGLTKAEAESLLSSYVYNPQGVTDVCLIAKHVFSDELQASYLLQSKARVYPPGRDQIEQPISEADFAAAKRILKQIEVQLIDPGSTSSFELFKRFDVDNDGYVSAADLASALATHSITASKREAYALMSILEDGTTPLSRNYKTPDRLLLRHSPSKTVHKTQSTADLPQQQIRDSSPLPYTGHVKKGYLTVHEFATRIQPNILQANAARLREPEENHMVGVVPSTQFLERQLKKSDQVTQFYAELNASLQPTSLDEFFKRPQTSYQAKRTDNIVQALPNTPGYLPEQHRLVRKAVNPINIDTEDRRKKQRCQTAKANRIRTVNDQMVQRAGQIEVDVQDKADRRVYSKAVKKEEYERRCHMYY